MRAYRYVVCDVFTERALEGNPLCVFPDAQGIESAVMQRLARETNLSETTFVLPPEQGGDAKVRIFTPVQELPFAGHPTLGTAFVLAETYRRAQIHLELGVGPITVTFELEGGEARFGWMKQPTPRSDLLPDPSAVLAALGVSASTLPVVLYDNGPRHVMVGVDSSEALNALYPDLRELAKATKAGVCVFAQANDGAEVRYFAPSAGVDEDPATGSAAGPLAVHLYRHDRWELERELVIRQGERMGRPARLVARLHQAEGALQVEVGGSVVVVARGEFLVPTA